MAAPYNPPVKNQDAVFFLGLEDYANPGRYKANPTIAAGDFKVSKDGGALANLTTLPSVNPAGSVMVMFTFSVTEKNCDNVVLVGIDQTVPPEWVDIIKPISTTTLTAVQSGDNYARLGAPAGASIVADIAANLTRLGVPVGASLSADLLTIIGYIDTEIAAIYARLGAPVGASLAADPVTLTAYVDTEVATLLTRLGVPGTTIVEVLTAIQAKTDQLTYGADNALNTNTTHVNEVAVGGSGTEEDPWGPEA